NNIGGVEYDKAALGTLIGAAAGYGISKGSANTSRQNNRAAAIGAVRGVVHACRVHFRTFLHTA
ncbi:MAG: hypothetical protein RSH52_28030, partial [Janthinobacterium sp.]